MFLVIEINVLLIKKLKIKRNDRSLYQKKM